MAEDGMQATVGAQKRKPITTDAQVRSAPVGMNPLGQGLYLLQVQGPSQRSWVHRYMLKGRTRYMGLGPYPTVTLAEARKVHAQGRALLARGIDPLAARDAMASPKGMTFRSAVARYIADHHAGWRSPKHAKQWSTTLTAYTLPDLGDKPCRAITVADVEAVLRPIWTAKPETAQRVRGRIETVIAAAHATEKWEPYSNPAKWRDNLALIFPSRRKIAPVRHFTALPWQDAPAFLARLRAISGVGALALEWTILTAARPMMTRGATWAEIDEAGRVWIVPPERLAAEHEGAEPVRVGSGLKAPTALRVPLTDAALRVLAALRPLRRPEHGDLLFAGTRAGQPVSDGTMAAVLRRLGRYDLTVHGFRSTFKDWASEATHHAPDISEAALAHRLPGGQTRAAYQRGDLYEKRRHLMEDWAEYLAPP